MTAVLPQMSAGKSFHPGIATGKFQGVMIPTTPIGRRIAIANLSGISEGTVSAPPPNERRAVLTGDLDRFVGGAAQGADLRWHFLRVRDAASPGGRTVHAAEHQCLEQRFGDLAIALLETT